MKRTSILMVNLLWVTSCGTEVDLPLGTDGVATDGQQLDGDAAHVCQEVTATNWDHVLEDRAWAGGWFYSYAFAIGSDEYLGSIGTVWMSPVTTLAETAPGHFELGECPGPSAIAITTPAEGDTLSGTVDLAVEVSEDIALVVYELYKDDALVMACESDVAPYGCNGFDSDYLTQAAGNGEYVVRATGTTELDEVVVSDDVHVTVYNTTPKITILSPEAGETVSGLVTFRAQVTDDAPITTVRFGVLVVGTTLCSTVDEAEPGIYECEWDSTAVDDGQEIHLVASAENEQGNFGYSEPVQFTVDNPEEEFVCQEWTTNNYIHVLAGRAFTDFFWHAVTFGGGDDLGFANIYYDSTVREVSEGYFEEGACE